MTLKKMAIISPGTFTTAFDKQAVQKALANFGYKPVYGAHAFEHDRFMAGSDDHRISDVMWGFENDDIDAVLCLRGGYGSLRILDRLNYQKIADHKKPFFGFSDMTALQWALWKKSGLVSFSGIQASFLQNPLSEKMTMLFKAYLNHENVTFEELTPVVPGTASGTVLGGTLSMIVSLIGTPYMPELTGKILVFEEVGEDPYRVDRMLTQLRLSGAFDRAAGIVLAGFHQCFSNDPLDGTIEQVIEDQFSDLSIPVVKDFMYGHGLNDIIFPIGASATLDAQSGVLKVHEY